MQVPPIPLPLLRDLICAHCRRFVTCGPVHVAPNGCILCGRCARVAKRSYRNVAFEAAASVFYYPCHFWPKHCNKKLYWNESLDHERNCLFQSSCSLLCSRPGTFFKSDRKLPTSGGINLEHVTDDILEKLSCMNCQCYLSNSPVHLNSEGKNICHRCYHASGTPKDAIRNLAYEKLAIALIFPCVYRLRGCTMRIRFGREMWQHERDCSYGHQPQTKITKKVSKDGKVRGVITTHSGHIYGTITPHHVPFAPPNVNQNEGNNVTQEFNEIIKTKKQKEDETKSFDDAQSMDSIMSRGTFESLDLSLGDNISRDNVSRDNVSRDNVSRDNVSRDNISRTSTRPSIRESNYTSHIEYRPSVAGNYLHPHPRPSSYDMQRHQKLRRPDDDSANFLDEVAPLPTPPGYNKISNNGYYQDNMTRYPRPSNLEQYAHYNYLPPLHGDTGPNLNYSSSFNYPQPHSGQNQAKRSESLKIGNPDIINELKERNNKKNNQKKEENPYQQCNNLQDIVQVHDEAFEN